MQLRTRKRDVRRGTRCKRCSPRSRALTPTREAYCKLYQLCERIHNAVIMLQERDGSALCDLVLFCE